MATEAPSPTPTFVLGEGQLPEGWRRVQVRGDFLGWRGVNADAGFTIDLPPGWDTGEMWPDTSGPTGWITGPAFSAPDERPVLTYNIGSSSIGYIERLEADERYEVRYPEIAGQEAVLHLGPRFGIYFRHIPGAPGREDAPPLRIEGGSRGFVDRELVAKILSSVRYEALPEEPPGIPEPEIVPGDDWVRVPARTDFYGFTMLLPPGWEFITGGVGDSFTGEATNGEISVRYDFGGPGGSGGGPYQPASRMLIGLPNPPHTAWFESRDRDAFFFAKPESEEPDESGLTAMWVNFDIYPSIRGSNIPYLSMTATGLTGDQQELVLAMMRTVEAEQGWPGRKPE